jgi:RND family efflux transporter MFP subunit
LNWKSTLAICLAILLLAVVVVSGIFMTEPTAQRSSATKRTAMLVEVTRGERGSFSPSIVATGTVRPEQEILLSPRVSGQVLAIADNFRPGGYVAEGEVLLQIDPADYETQLLQRRSELHQAEAELEMEVGRQEQAKREYEGLKGTISDRYKTLVLREPQVQVAEAAVETAAAAVRQAELDLERTLIRAPFAAHVLSRDAHVGSQVTPGLLLGRLVGIDAYWVEATVPMSSLRWIEFPTASHGAGQGMGQGMGRGMGQDVGFQPAGQDLEGATAEVRNRSAWAEGVFRQGRVNSLIGALEDETRLARVLVTVADPLAQSPQSAGQPPLMVGAFVEVRIAGKPIDNVVRLQRNYLRQNNTVWIKQDGLLQIRPVEVVFSDDEYVYIAKGLEADEDVVTTNLATVVEGSSLRLGGESIEPTSPGRDG